MTNIRLAIQPAFTEIARSHVFSQAVTFTGLSCEFTVKYVSTERHAEHRDPYPICDTVAYHYHECGIRRHATFGRARPKCRSIPLHSLCSAYSSRLFLPVPRDTWRNTEIVWW
jgi:hypothetical protein